MAVLSPCTLYFALCSSLPVALLPVSVAIFTAVKLLCSSLSVTLPPVSAAISELRYYACYTIPHSAYVD